MADFVSLKNLYVAKILKDTETEFEVDTPIRLSRMAEATQTIEQSQNTVYYDDVPAYSLNSKGATTITIVCEALNLEKLAILHGQTLDTETGALIDDGQPTATKFVVMFEAGYVDGSGARYYSFLNSTISVPDEGSKTRDAGTDTVNQTLTITCANTTHSFKKRNKTEKAVICDTEHSGQLLNLENWYQQAVTPDSLATLKKI